MADPGGKDNACAFSASGGPQTGWRRLRQMVRLAPDGCLRPAGSHVVSPPAPQSREPAGLKRAAGLVIRGDRAISSAVDLKITTAYL
jgi:hypothetical protein